MNKLEKAKEYCAKALKISEKLDEKIMISNIYIAYGIIYKVSNDWEKSTDYFKRSLQILEQLEELSGQRYIDPFNFAIIYASLHEKEKALHWLTSAYEQGSPQMLSLQIYADYILKNISSEPKYRELIALMRYPEIGSKK